MTHIKDVPGWELLWHVTEEQIDIDLKKTMKELESMLTIMDIEGLSSKCYIYVSDFGDYEGETIAEYCDNFCECDIIRERFMYSKTKEQNYYTGFMK